MNHDVLILFTFCLCSSTYILRTLCNVNDRVVFMDTRYYEKADREKDFDIGHFVRSYDCLKGQLDKFNTVLRTTDSLRRWEVPSVTLLCCVFVITVCISFPELLLASCLSPIPMALLATGIKNIGQREKKQIKHIVVMAVETDEQKLERKKEAIAKATKDLRRFIKIMCELQCWLKEACQRLDLLQSLFSWEDPWLTLRFIGCTFALMFLVILVPLSWIMLALFLVMVFNNEAFMKVLIKYLTLLRVYVPKSETIYDKKEDEWFDAYGDGESDNSSYEDESNGSDFEDTFDTVSDNSVNQNSERRSTSIVSHISKYRKLRQELSKGNCASCEVAFSLLLTRRRYCRRCGDKFCSKCCRLYVKKSALGATAPGSRDQRVLVCNDCYAKLRVTKAPD